jgi:hypothetical protein
MQTGIKIKRQVKNWWRIRYVWLTIFFKYGIIFEYGNINFIFGWVILYHYTNTYIYSEPRPWFVLLKGIKPGNYHFIVRITNVADMKGKYLLCPNLLAATFIYSKISIWYWNCYILFNIYPKGLYITHSTAFLLCEEFLCQNHIVLKVGKEFPFLSINLPMRAKHP